MDRVKELAVYGIFTSAYLGGVCATISAVDAGSTCLSKKDNITGMDRFRYYLETLAFLPFPAFVGFFAGGVFALSSPITVPAIMFYALFYRK